MSNCRLAGNIFGAMVVLSTILRFVQEGRSNRAAEQMKSMVSNHATVKRIYDGQNVV